MSARWRSSLSPASGSKRSRSPDTLEEAWQRHCKLSADGSRRAACKYAGALYVPPKLREFAVGRHYYKADPPLKPMSGGDFDKWRRDWEQQLYMLHNAPENLDRVNAHEEEFGSGSESGEGVWRLLSKEVAEHIDDSIISLASFHPGGHIGSSLFFACTGVIIKSNEASTSFVTSLSLVRSIDDDSKILHDLRIEVRLPNNYLCIGMLEHYDLEHNVAVTGVGGPLVDFKGDFVGMNFYAKEESPFLPRDKILDLLTRFKTTPPRCWDKSKARESHESHESDLEGSSSPEMKNKKLKPSICTICDPECQSELEDRLVKRLPRIYRWPHDWGFVSVESRIDKFKSRGYPLPVLEDCGMKLRYNFEDQFSEDIWSKLAKRVASNMSRSVVALASFSGGARLFACTGVSIDCNGSTTRVLTSGSLVRSCFHESKVADDLKIEVRLPDKRHVPGTLQHYNMHYNVAVVIIEKFRCTRTANIDNNVKTDTLSEAIAIGRIYESGKLMAASGTLFDKKRELDCDDLKISTCEITKAGIGGPLIDFNGNFIGMNFYGLEETPYMPKDIILKLLTNFDAEGTVDADFTEVPNPNRWHVPKPYWCYPSWHDVMEEVDILELFGAEFD
ncbi:uncharacterized protein LOC124664378 [Lolium rigidum]|uniref:uncharacterized protein LOC124664378 n=1 Tax=Lolium rigidum TaxID=89674 RepID=UPI001F5D91F2|nr:uncharacterized protein LOC124664378 [Lolium rigidum]